MSGISPEPLAAVSSERNYHRLRQRDDGALVLEPREPGRMVTWCGLALALLGVGAWPVSWLAGTPLSTSLSFAVLFVLAGLACIVAPRLLSRLGTRAVFDLTHDTITLSGGRHPGQPTFSRRQVAALQLCGPVAHREWRSYQLNLVLAPGVVAHDRLTLLDNSDRAALGRLGAELAEFLQMPLLSHVSD